MISSITYQERRNILLEKLGQGVYILPSYPERKWSNDTFHPYRQHSDMLYFTGYSHYDSIAVIINNRTTLSYYLFIQNRDPVKEVYDGSRIEKETAKTQFGADDVYHFTEFSSKISEILLEMETVYYIDGQNPVIDNVVYESIRKAKQSKNKVGRGPVRVIDPSFEMQEIRIIKTEEEIRILEKAASISAKAITKAIQKTKPGMMEYQIQAIIEAEFKKAGAQGPAYGSICATGKNATILHYIDNQDQLEPNDLILVDAGAQYNDYCADITRTWPVNGRFNQSQEKLYSLVLHAQKTCIDMVKPGVKFGDIAKKSDEILVQGLIDLGLLEGEVYEIIQSGTHRQFIKHGLGHWVGLDVHDTSCVTLMETELPIGAYITIEPGLYIPSNDEIPKNYHNIGIRIEDDILVTKNGHRILTSEVVKEIVDIHKLLADQL